jgi:hypothetical protein
MGLTAAKQVCYNARAKLIVYGATQWKAPRMLYVKQSSAIE